MTLKINLIAVIIITFTAEEMIEANLVQSCCRSISRNMSADSAVHFICLNHHCHCIPADDAFYSSFNFAVAGKWRLLFPWNGIDVRRICGKGNFNSSFMRSYLKLLKKLCYPFWTTMLKHIIERVKPLFCF